MRSPAPLSLILALVVGSEWVGSAVLRWSASGADLTEAVWQLSFVTYAVLGALLVRRRPDVAVGWLLLVTGLLTTVIPFMGHLSPTAVPR